MPKRRKRLAKGIESIKRQIELHEKKLAAAKEAGNIYLADYYKKEMESLKAAAAKKKSALQRK